MYKSKSYFECPPYPDGKYYKEWCVNFDKKICFITINKNAGSSIREGLKCHGFNNVLVDYQHLSSYLDALKNFKFLRVYVSYIRHVFNLSGTFPLAIWADVFSATLFMLSCLEIYKFTVFVYANE